MKLTHSHLLFLAFSILYLLIRIYFQRRVSATKKVQNRASLGDRLVILLVAGGQGLIPLLFLFTPWFDWANYILPDFLMIPGAMLMMFGVWLFWRAHKDLDNNWSVTLELSENHKLITLGVYRYLRHPMYASFFVLAFGQAMLINNWLAGVAALLAVSLLYWLRLPHEEKMMLDHFGDEYQRYMRRTGGVWPRF